jgi:uncharacterized RDD family membrane protein YckC
MSLGEYVGLCIAAWIVGVIVVNAISMLLGAAYAEATVSVLIGFWLGKAATKNKHRGWASIIAFPIITLVAGLLGTSIGLALVSQNPGSTNFSVLIALAIAFGLSYAPFAFLIRDRSPQRANQ